MPIVGEEAASAGDIPDVSNRFWLVDPIDGTKEFINRNGEFTVNIALIDHGVPVLGLVLAPALGALYGGAAGLGAWVEIGVQRRPLAVRTVPTDGLTVVGSRHHGNDSAVDNFLAGRLVAAHRAVGSSLKLCLIAEGLADVYPRFGRTMEWDTAAGDAVLRAAGGMVRTIAGAPLGYGKAGFENPDFAAWDARPPENVARAVRRPDISGPSTTIRLMHTTTQSKYRQDIDGLRAISVLLVLIFHFSWFPPSRPGFIGVDVFFVISGFLITGIVTRQLEAGTFSLRDFYTARVRRLAPALVATLAATFCAGLVLLFPDDLRELSTQLIASQAYVANIYFWRTVNYFGLSGANVFLLHTWSLAVEEQFYLFYPLVLLLLHRFVPKRWFAGLAVLFIVSFGLNVAFVNANPKRCSTCCPRVPGSCSPVPSPRVPWQI